MSIYVSTHLAALTTLYRSIMRIDIRILNDSVTLQLNVTIIYNETGRMNCKGDMLSRNLLLGKKCYRTTTCFFLLAVIFCLLK